MDNNPIVLQGGVEYNDYRPYIRDFYDKLVVNGLKYSPSITGVNPAARAYVANFLGVSNMDNNAFYPNEINAARNAWKNTGIKTNNVIGVEPIHYAGNVEKTTGWLNPIRNAIVNPMRMTTGSMYVSPAGDLLHVLNNNYYYGDPYDFAKQVQGNSDYNPVYQFMQKLGTTANNLREGNPMMINLNLGDNK